MEIVVPDALRDRVHVDGDHLRFRARAPSALGQLQAGLTSLFDRAYHDTLEVRVSPSGVHVGVTGRRIPHEHQALRLVGEPGSPANLFVNGADIPLLYTAVAPPSGPPWTTHQILWLGRSIAAILRIPLRVEWDTEAWDRWNADPVHRGQLALENEVATSRRQHPELHGYALEEPPGKVTLEGARYRLGRREHVTLTAEGVRSARWEIPWEAVHGAAAVFGQLPDGNVRGFLTVSYGEQLLRLAIVERVVPKTAVHLRYVAQQIRHRSREHKTQERGTVADIPDALNDLRPGAPSGG